MAATPRDGPSGKKVGIGGIRSVPDTRCSARVDSREGSTGTPPRPIHHPPPSLLSRGSGHGGEVEDAGVAHHRRGRPPPAGHRRCQRPPPKMAASAYLPPKLGAPEEAPLTETAVWLRDRKATCDQPTAPTRTLPEHTGAPGPPPPRPAAPVPPSARPPSACGARAVGERRGDLSHQNYFSYGVNPPKQWTRVLR